MVMVAVVGIPFDEFSSFLRGSAQAPASIRAAFHSDSSNYFTEQGLDLKNALGWKDEGDLKLSSGQVAIAEIHLATARILKTYSKIFSLGGDHATTYPVVKAVADKYGQLNILHFDAHPDLYDNFDGNKFSHACPFARIMEEKLAKRLVQVGIRTMNKHQREQALLFGAEVIEMKDWNPALRIHFDGPAFISLDMDVFDPAFAPGVSHREPGGFSSRELITTIQNLNLNLVGADLVEFNPTRDTSGITAMLAAKLFKELLDLLLRSK